MLRYCRPISDQLVPTPSLGDVCLTVHRYDLRCPMIPSTVQAGKTVLQNYRCQSDDLA
ncbi:MAG: hypothetical protein GX564_08080 [Oligosphaeraceae bacterium]|nr:hypothetical protein [Oligosphaeraceae bacterium]